MIQYVDDYGTHRHQTSTPGRPYDPNVPITCKACIARLDVVLYKWLDKLSERENLPEGFWNGYKFPWSD